MEQEFNLISAIRVILKWKKPLMYVILASGVIAALWSFFVMEEYYLSWSTFYPTNQYLNDRANIFNSETKGGQIDYFGGKGDVNRILTIANSEPLIDYIVDSFKLTEHYKIDRNSKYWRTKVRKKFEKNYEAIKTEKDAVEISLYDTDPKLAATMVNAIVEKVDEQNKSHINEIKKQLYDVLAAQIEEQQKGVAGYVDTLADLAARYNIKLSLAAGSTVLVTGTDFKALVDGNSFKAVQEYKALLVKQDNALKELNNRINIRDQMRVAMSNDASSLYVVEHAFVADRKEKPVRSLVILITLIVTTFVSIIGIFLIEQIDDIKQKLKIVPGNKQAEA